MATLRGGAQSAERGARRRRLLRAPRSALCAPRSLLPVVLPEAKAADEGVLVVAQAAALRQRGQPLGVAAAQHDVVGDQRVLEHLDDLEHLVLPLLLAQPL